MYQIQKITMDSITEAQFKQMISIAQVVDPDPFIPEMLQDCIDNLYTVACLDGDTVIGFAVVNPNSKKYLGGSLYVVDINVRQENRRQGIGEKLLETAFGAFPECHKLSLDVEKGNVGTIALYRKMEFHDTDIPTQNVGTYTVMIKEE